MIFCSLAGHYPQAMAARQSTVHTTPVGERGPELFSPGVSGQIIPNPGPPPIRAMGGGGGVTVSTPITIDAKGADAVGLARVSGQLAALQAELPGRMKQIIKERGHKWR